MTAKAPDLEWQSKEYLATAFILAILIGLTLIACGGEGQEIRATPVAHVSAPLQATPTLVIPTVNPAMPTAPTPSGLQQSTVVVPTITGKPNVFPPSMHTPAPAFPTARPPTVVPDPLPTPIPSVTPTPAPDPTSPPPTTPSATLIPTASPIPGPERAINDEPWVRDGVINRERPYVEAVTELVYISSAAFQSLAARPWMDRPGQADNQDDLEAIKQLTRLATVNETVALLVLDLPFSMDQQAPDPLVLAGLANLAEDKPDVLGAIIAHPIWTQETAAPSLSDITLSILEVTVGPGAAFSVKDRWFTEYAEENDPTRQRVMKALQAMGIHAPRLTDILLTGNDEWLPPTEEKEVDILGDLAAIGSADEQAALQLIQMHFMQEVGVRINAEFFAAKVTGELADLALADPRKIGELMAQLDAAQWDIDVHSAPLIELYHLGVTHPGAAEAIKKLPWVEDGLTFVENNRTTLFYQTEQHLLYGESRIVGKLVYLARSNPELAMELAALPWMGDGVNLTEDNILSEIEELERYPSSVTYVVSMPFMKNNDLNTLLIARAVVKKVDFSRKTMVSHS